MRSVLRNLVTFTLATLALSTCTFLPPIERSDMNVRVLTYNIHHAEGMDGTVDLERIAQVIRSQAPDLVFLQEIDRGMERSGKLDQVEQLARSTGMLPSFLPTLEFDPGQYGILLLSRWPAHRVRHHPMPSSGEARGLLEVQFETLTVFVTHLDHQSTTHRQESADLINQIMQDRPNELAILGGDLNAEPGSDPIISLLREWRSVSDDAYLSTYPADQPSRQLDYLMVRPRYRWNVRQVEVLDEAVASDHRPLMADLELVHDV